MISDFCRLLNRILGSYTLGLVLMSMMLILTFRGTWVQVEGATGGMANPSDLAAEFFGSLFVLIPLGGGYVPLALPLPGMGVCCFLLFVNVLAGGIVRAPWGCRKVGLLMAHAGVLVLLLGVALGGVNRVEVGGINLTRGVSVRPSELPFGIELQEFRAEFYLNTSKPKSFESDIFVIDDDGTRRAAHICMNAPFRYMGWTLYQTSWGESPTGKVSVLTATHNPYEHVPTYASFVIALGLLLHFVVKLLKKARKCDQFNQNFEQVDSKCVLQDDTGAGRSRWGLGLMGLAVICLFLLGMQFAVPRVSVASVAGYQPWEKQWVEEMAVRVPVLDGGRVKPLETFARLKLLGAYGKNEYKFESVGADGVRESVAISPTEWLLDMMLRPEFARQYKCFYVRQDDVIARLGLPVTEGKRKYYSFNELAPRLSAIYDEAIRLDKLPKLLEVDQGVVALAQQLRQAQLWLLMPELALTTPDAMKVGFPVWFREGETWSSLPNKNEAKNLARASVAARDALPNKDEELRTQAQDYLVKALSVSFDAHNEMVYVLQNEVQYNKRTQWSLPIFLTGFVLVCVSLLVANERAVKWLNGFAYGAGALGVYYLVQGIWMRTEITMRSPVSNTYEMMVCIALIGVVVAMVIERYSRRGFVLGCGLLLGAAACQLSAFYAASSGADSLDPLIAILRANVLLSTHVITIVLGYAAGLLAAVVGHFYLMGVATNQLTQSEQSFLSRVAYSVLAFSLLFTLAGTVFGGVWANESWGRFWGWDPKENGALIIVLWQLMVLHAIKGKMLGNFGLQLANVVGGVLIAFAWWGVNSLGVGMHSYSFSSGTSALTWFFTIEAVFITAALGCRFFSKPTS